MRGKEATDKRESRVIRITPAYAGKSNGQKSKCGLLQDHPRVCGEKQGGSLFGQPFPGSPPRMRGKD